MVSCTCDDFWWLGRQDLFEKQVTMPGCITKPMVVLAIRAVFFTLMIVTWLLLWISDPNPFDDGMYLTQWGSFFTTVTLGMSLYYIPGREIAERSKEESQNIFAGWKWYCLLYEFSLSTEILITGYYWALEFASRDPNQGPIADMHSNFVHILPLVFLLFDFCFLSATPFLIRHELFNFIIKMLYMVVNMSISLASSPVYGLITWRSGLGVGLPLALIVVVGIFHVILYFITICKLKCLGHKEMVELLQNECCGRSHKQVDDLELHEIEAGPVPASQ